MNSAAIIKLCKGRNSKQNEFIFKYLAVDKRNVLCTNTQCMCCSIGMLLDFPMVLLGTILVNGVRYIKFYTSNSQNFYF